MSKQSFTDIFRIVIAAIAWFALALQLSILISNTPENGMTPLQAVGRFLIFFTILCNVLVATSLTIVLAKPSSRAGRFFGKPFFIGAMAVYIFIVGVVYNVILRRLWHPTGMDRVADELLHVAVPSLYTLYWLFFTSKGFLKWRYAFQWLIFPLVYLIYALTRGSMEGFYPYPFLDLSKLSFGRVLLNCGGLTSAFLVTGVLFISVDKMMSGRKMAGKNIDQ